MSRGINKVILVGNIGQDPEVRYLPNGGAVANVSLATSESWQDKNSGQKQEKTEWHRIVFFGKLADIVSQYVKKGSKLYVEGKLQTRKWQDQNGNDRYSTEIVVGPGGQMQMLDGRNDSGGQPQQQQPQQQPQQPNPYAQAQSGQIPQQNHQQAHAQYAQQQPQQAPAGMGSPASQSQYQPQQGDDFEDDIPF